VCVEFYTHLPAYGTDRVFWNIGT